MKQTLIKCIKKSGFKTNKRNRITTGPLRCYYFLSVFVLLAKQDEKINYLATCEMCSEAYEENAPLKAGFTTMVQNKKKKV